MSASSSPSVPRVRSSRPTITPPTEALDRECLTALGGQRAVLVVTVSPAVLKGFALDSTSGFLLSLLDGNTTVQEVLDIAGLPRLITLQRLRSLLSQGIIAVAF